MSIRKTINPESKIKLVGMRLSGDETTKVIDNTDGVNGKLNETSDGRAFYMADFQDPDNPFAPVRTRMVSQQFDSADNPVWKAGNPAMIKKFVGKLIPGEIITLDVPDFQIGERVVNTATSVVLKGENIQTIFRQAGHDLDEEEQEDDAQLETTVESEPTAEQVEATDDAQLPE